MAEKSVVGLRILVVEDETLLAMVMEELLAEFGCQIVGPIGVLSEALETARLAELDCAILDVNIQGSTVYPVAEILTERNIPFAFATGYGPSEIQKQYDARAVLRKPFRLRDLRKCIDVLASHRGSKLLSH